MLSSFFAVSVLEHDILRAILKVVSQKILSIGKQFTIAIVGKVTVVALKKVISN